MKTALLVIDMINEFITGKFGNERAQAVVSSAKRLIDAAREAGIPVIHVTDAHLPGIDREFDIWGSHAEVGTKAAEIVADLQPRKGDYHLYKRRYSAFFATGLDITLRELEVDEVIIMGVVTNICIQHTAADAFFRGYSIVVPRDCVEAVDVEAQENSLNFMKEIYGAKITTSMEIIEGLRGA